MFKVFRIRKPKLKCRLENGFQKHLVTHAHTPKKILFIHLYQSMREHYLFSNKIIIP